MSIDVTVGQTNAQVKITFELSRSSLSSAGRVDNPIEFEYWSEAFSARRAVAVNTTVGDATIIITLPPIATEGRYHLNVKAINLPDAYADPGIKVEEIIVRPAALKDLKIEFIPDGRVTIKKGRPGKIRVHVIDADTNQPVNCYVRIVPDEASTFDVQQGTAHPRVQGGPAEFVTEEISVDHLQGRNNYDFKVEVPTPPLGYKPISVRNSIYIEVADPKERINFDVNDSLLVGKVGEQNPVIEITSFKQRDINHGIDVEFEIYFDPQFYPKGLRKVFTISTRGGTSSRQSMVRQEIEGFPAGTFAFWIKPLRVLSPNPENYELPDQQDIGFRIEDKTLKDLGVKVSATHGNMYNRGGNNVQLVITEGDEPRITVNTYDRDTLKGVEALVNVFSRVFSFSFSGKTRLRSGGDKADVTTDAIKGLRGKDD